jgi:hypothetical protein
MEGTGKRMPLDALPIGLDDNPVLAAARRKPDGTLSARALVRCGTLFAGEHYARSHFASCPHADAHRKAKT